MKSKFLDTVKKYSMFSTGERVVVALSGGADSMCLLSLLNEFKDYFGITLSAVHVNHCIRGDESDRDENFVRKFCLDNDIPLSVYVEDIPSIASVTGESTELCARRIRYEVFGKCNADKIATAHSASDRIETFIFNLSRGAALNGLCSIPPVRDNIVRPLIAVTRSEIENYCHSNGIEYVTDSSNLTDEYTRNKIRHKVIPELISINSSFEKNALRCIEILNDENAYTDILVGELFDMNLHADGRLQIPANVNISHLRRLVVRYLDYLNISYENSHISYICENMGERFAVVLPGNRKIVSDGGYIFLEEKKEECREPLQEIVFNKNDGISFEYNGRKAEVGISEDKSSIKGYCVDAGKIGERLTLRKRLPGDSIKTDKKRCSRQLKKIYNEMKISPDDREYLYVLCDDQGVIFAEGVGVDAGRMADDNTESFLTIKMESVNNE